MVNTSRHKKLERNMKSCAQRTGAKVCFFKMSFQRRCLAKYWVKHGAMPQEYRQVFDTRTADQHPIVPIHGGFHKWGYPQMDGFYWKIPSMHDFGVPPLNPIYVNPHKKIFWQFSPPFPMGSAARKRNAREGSLIRPNSRR